MGGDFAKVSKKLKGGILLFVVLGDFGFDVTCQACPENSLIALGSQPPLVTRIARTGLGMRLVLIKHWLGQLDYKIGSSKVVVVSTEYSGRLGGFVLSYPPNLDPVLERFCAQNNKSCSR